MWGVVTQYTVGNESQIYTFDDDKCTLTGIRFGISSGRSIGMTYEPENSAADGLLYHSTYSSGGISYKETYSGGRLRRVRKNGSLAESHTYTDDAG